ncbi:MAG: isoleucine--tRNA ligase [Robiginitomaculum sp.]|nr:MAG: isoleucine--tRNA ligase [Robiginitomaculum sp.]
MNNKTNAPTGGRDYRETLVLPKTDFPMRAGLPKREPEWIARWQKLDIYGEIRKNSKGREKFSYHDGPPYANGHVHLGTALNKILKDFVVRSHQMMGYDASFVPGWDCHGLPIEWKVEEGYRNKGKAKDDVPIDEFRAECRSYAGHWLDIQREEFKRLGVFADWDNPYTTMAYSSEARIASEFLKFAEAGKLYRGSKPVMWSPVEQTALAEAEVEYADHVSTTIWVKFKVIEHDITNLVRIAAGLAQNNNTDFDERAFRETHDLKGANVVIWTTTPWTIPANRAIAYNPNIAEQVIGEPASFVGGEPIPESHSEFGYGVYEVEKLEQSEFEPWAKVGERYIVANSLAESVKQAGKISRWKYVCNAKKLDTVVCAHPFAELDPYYKFETTYEGITYSGVHLFPAAHVTDESGTGFVHTAPGHGADDYDVWLDQPVFQRQIPKIPETVGPDGVYYDHVPLFAGLNVIRTTGKKTGQDGKANAEVLAKLTETGALLARGRITHSYPHSWRSKAPVIYRNTPQWFIPMEDDKGAEGLRAKALAALGDTEFFPPRGANRIGAMVADRPDWLISRQRAWGVPLTLFVREGTGEYLQNAQVNARIIAAIEAEGADAWVAENAKERFLKGLVEDWEGYEKITDILDVWFDSGCSHAFTLEDREDQQWPADVYLEGSDQHRGWFQSSLLESCGTRGRAPYNKVVTHGFIMAEDGRKMSKSLGNTMAPDDVARQYGIEILRLWTASSDYQEDLRIGDEILKTSADSYRKIRNTLRYLLGALTGYEASEELDVASLPSLERLILHRLVELDEQVKTGYRNFDYKGVFGAIFTFCNADLSQLFFDIRKDSLYCDPLDKPRRKAALYVMDKVFHSVVRWLAPILPFTTEETWLNRFPSETDSVHLHDFAKVDANWNDLELAGHWAAIRKVRKVVLGALEVERREKRMGSSLQGAPIVSLENSDDLASIAKMAEGDVEQFFGDVCITSGMTLRSGPGNADEFSLDDVPGVSVASVTAEGVKCARSWKYFDPKTADPAFPDITPRDALAVAQWDAANG